MAPGRRPGGLTALAVLNFVFSGLGLLSVLGLIAILKFADALAADAAPQDRAVFEAFQSLNMGIWAFIVISSLVANVALLVAGIGYLKLRRWGRLFGNGYALVAIASSIVSVVALPAEVGGGFGIGTIIGLVYPVLTLILINTTFKDDLS